MQAAFRLAVVASMLLLDAMASHVLISFAASFVLWEVVGAYQSALGRLAWLLLFLYMAKDSIAEGIALADHWRKRFA